MLPRASVCCGEEFGASPKKVPIRRGELLLPVANALGRGSYCEQGLRCVRRHLPLPSFFEYLGLDGTPHLNYSSGTVAYRRDRYKPLRSRRTFLYSLKGQEHDSNAWTDNESLHGSGAVTLCASRGAAAADCGDRGKQRPTPYVY